MNYKTDTNGIAQEIEEAREAIKPQPVTIFSETKDYSKRRAFFRLETWEQNLVIMHYNLGLSYREIASRLKCSHECARYKTQNIIEKWKSYC